MPRKRKSIDPELQQALGVRSIDALDRLLGFAPDREPVEAGEVAALVRLIRQALRAGG